MESLSRPLHRRKLANANNFSGKHAYDGVFSGHRRNYDGAPSVKVEEYREIFNSDRADSSIPVLDLPSLEESCDGFNLEMWSMKPDYGNIFGGFRDQGIAICYEQLVARDKARARVPSSASQSSQDLGDLSTEPLDAFKQFNMAYNKISQRNKDGLDGTKHVKQSPAVSGFTCFINESASQPKETKNQKFVTNNMHSGVNSSKVDFHEKQASRTTAEFRSRHQDESLSGDRNFKTFEVDLKPHPSKVSSPPEAPQPKKEAENQISFVTNNILPSMNSSKGDFPEKQTSQSTLEFKSGHEDESLSIDNIVKTFEVDLKPHPSKVSSPPEVSQPNKEMENQTLQSAIEVDLKPHPSKVSPPHTTYQLDKETENQTSYITNNIHLSVNSSKGDFHEKQSSQSAVECRSRYQDESLSGDGIFKTFDVDLKPHPSEVSSAPAASQPNKVSGNQISYVTTNFHPSVNSSKGDSQTSPSAVEVDLKPHPSNVSPPPLASQLNKETENRQSYITNDIHSSVDSRKGDFHEKQTSQSAVECRSRYQDESVSSDKVFKTFEVDLKPHPSKVSSPPAVSRPIKETKDQKSYIANDIHPSENSSKGEFHEEQTSQSTVESRSRHSQDESTSDDRNVKKFEVDLKPQPSNVSSPPAASQPNKANESQQPYITNNIHPCVNSSKGGFHEKHTSQSAVESRSRYGQDEFQADLRSHPPKYYQNISTATYGESPPTCFADEFEVNSAAAVSAAALRKAIEKAQENIRIAKESVGRKKGLGGFSSKRFKDSLKVKAKTANVKASVECEEKDDKMKEKDPKHEGTVIFPDFMDGEKLFGAKTCLNELHGQIPELGKNSEILLRSPVELREHKILCSSKKVIEKTESKSIENNTCEGPQKDVEKPNDFFVLEICEKNPGDNESNNLTMHQKVEDEKEIPSKFDEDGYEKKFSEASFGLFETSKQENVQQESCKKVGRAASQVEDEREVKEEEKEKLYDVCEVEVLKDVETDDCSIERTDLSQKEDHEINEKENDKVEDTWKKFDNANENRSMTGASQTVDDIEEACKVDQNGNNAGSSQEIDDVGKCSSSGHEFQVEDTETIEKDKMENISSNETEDNKDECDAKSDDPANCGVADMDAVQNDYRREPIVLFQKEDYETKERENHSTKETWKKLEKIQVPEESKSVIGASQVVDDTEEACKVDQTENNAESSQEINDVSRSSSSGLEFQVEDTEALERKTFENISSNETEDNRDECDSKKSDRIQVPETYENLSSDYGDAAESESVIGERQIVDDGEETCKVDQNNNSEPSQEIDDVSSSRSSSCHDFQEEDTGAFEKEMIANLSSDETEDNEDGCDANSDDLANCGLADMDFVQNDMQSESSSDTILGMEMEVNEYKEREETVEKEDNNFEQSHEETPEIRIKMESGTQQEPGNASKESEPSEMVEKMHNEEEREQERIKLAVERAIREARARAFAEVRQRVIADTQEKVTKRSSDKTRAQSKLKAERAAVERATAEARQRALEKAISQKKISEPKIQVKEINQATSAINHTNTESALRSKAKLEKHNRIMERAAKALAEKEMRDLLALREQAERNRLAENLDADIKRWSNGKEGNLRALLSTLQYILGADSGWQPVSLTEIITTSAVKKAYRKATLCVHPDKLQQRGASIQQKYICEKVFDLLKAAWNRFNSEER